MREAFLHYVWQYQRFEPSNLQTTNGENLVITKTGYLNNDSGPDFVEASVRLNNIDWRGHVEIHINSSDWYHHRHDRDQNYQNVILHVVWNNDRVVRLADDSIIPTLELKGRVNRSLVDRYENLINFPGSKIPCERQFHSVDRIYKSSMVDKLAVERLMQKSGVVLSELEVSNGDWQEIGYRLLAKNFGLKVNGENFSALAESLPYKLLRKYHGSLMKIEALLFGMAGYLEDEGNSEYRQALFSEFDFLRYKHDLTPALSKHQWKTLRMRPANFPTLRIAQFASLTSSIDSFFQLYLQTDIELVRTALKVEVSEFWKTHYTFKRASEPAPKPIGDQMIDLILINTVAPILAAYSQYKDDQAYLDQAVNLLAAVKPESNKITRVYNNLGMKAQSAFDSQAMIQWYNEYCNESRCLECTVGTALIGGKGRI